VRKVEGWLAVATSKWEKRMPDTALDALKQAIQGLTYQSETDAPFRAFTWNDGGDKLTRDVLLKLSGHKPKAKVEEVPLDDFFNDLTADQDWYGDEEKATAQKYRDLLRTVKDQLAAARVFKVGKVRRDIYIVGKTRDGTWAGVQTEAVET
jgi:hypothetical protein